MRNNKCQLFRFLSFNSCASLHIFNSKKGKIVVFLFSRYAHASLILWYMPIAKRNTFKLILTKHSYPYGFVKREITTSLSYNSIYFSLPQGMAWNQPRWMHKVHFKSSRTQNAWIKKTIHSNFPNFISTLAAFEMQWFNGYTNRDGDYVWTQRADEKRRETME